MDIYEQITNLEQSKRLRQMLGAKAFTFFCWLGTEGNLINRAMKHEDIVAAGVHEAMSDPSNELFWPAYTVTELTKLWPEEFVVDGKTYTIYLSPYRMPPTHMTGTPCEWIAMISYGVPRGTELLKYFTAQTLIQACVDLTIYAMSQKWPGWSRQEMMARIKTEEEETCE